MNSLFGNSTEGRSVPLPQRNAAPREKVEFPESVKDETLKYAVIAARYKDKWVFVKHRERDTLEVPGGHREAGENIAQTAARELFGICSKILQG